MKISIITATYNSGSTLRDTIESVLNQTYKDIEYLIVDGASTDNTLKIAQEYKPYFKGKMRIISEPDKGIYDAMNKGITAATGDVIGILNSDDFYTSNNILVKIKNVFEMNEVDAVYGDIHFVDNDNLNRCVRYYSSKNFRPWKMRMGYMPAHPSFYCKKEVYNKYGVFDCSFKIGADFENLLRFIFVNKIKTKYVALDCVTMRTGGVSTSGISSHKQIFNDHMRAYKKNNINSNWLLEGSRYILKAYELCLQKIGIL
ncbi:MAG: glycosyltransferase family 2 protein [bacterium]